MLGWPYEAKPITSLPRGPHLVEGVADLFEGAGVCSHSALELQKAICERHSDRVFCFPPLAAQPEVNHGVFLLHAVLDAGYQGKVPHTPSQCRQI
jgi:hypothetical protein